MKSDPPITEEDKLSLKKLLRAKLINLAPPMPAWAEEMMMRESEASQADFDEILVLGGRPDYSKMVKVEHFLRRWTAGGITQDGSPVLDERSPHRGTDDVPSAGAEALAVAYREGPTVLQGKIAAAARTGVVTNPSTPVTRERPFVFQTPAAQPAVKPERRRAVRTMERQPAIDPAPKKPAPPPTPQPPPTPVMTQKAHAPSISPSQRLVVDSIEERLRKADDHQGRKAPAHEGVTADEILAAAGAVKQAEAVMQRAEAALREAREHLAKIALQYAGMNA